MSDTQIITGYPTAPVTPQQFIAAFPAFSDAGRFPLPSIQLWLDTSYATMDAGRWKSNYLLYGQLKAAHYLAIEDRSNRSAQRGGEVGGAQGILSSKSAGPVSAGYDVGNAVATEGGADYWNQTTYGQRYWQKARLVGMGGTQFVGAGGFLGGSFY